MKNTRPVNGILLLNKALNITSNTALQQVKRLYQAKKAGHTGSLDPLATGVLPICFGEATKFSQYLLDADKIYTVWGRLGCTTKTGDAEGEVCVIDDAPDISEVLFKQALVAFIGTTTQIPPMYSALKKDGVPLYQLARQGQEIERDARTIVIHDIQLKSYHYPDFEITVHCSKGTYIRTLVEDIGKYVDSGAYLLGLRRDKAGPYSLENTYTLEALTQMPDMLLASLPYPRDLLLLPAETAVAHFPALYLNLLQATMLQQGKVVPYPEFSLETTVRLFHPDYFLGLGKISSDGCLRAQRLIACRG